MKILNKKKITLLIGSLTTPTILATSIACSSNNELKKTNRMQTFVQLKNFDINTNTLVDYEQSKKVPMAFSKTNKNILVLGIDTLGNSEINFLDESGSSNKARIFNNFKNYTNVVAAGRSTNTGMPAIVGGWMSNPLLWSDKRIDVYNENENFQNLSTRTEMKQMYNWKNYQTNNYKEFVNAINHDKFDFKALNTEYFAGGDELKGDSISVQGFKKTFPKVESALQYWKDTNGESKNLYKTEYKLDYPKLGWHHNYFEKMRKNIKTYEGKGKFNWSWAQQLHPRFFAGSPENPKYDNLTDLQRKDNKPVVKHSFNQIEKMFKKMKKDGVWDNTLIFIVSDHGYKIREESIMMVKPYDNKEKYTEIDDVMLSNYDFPMILNSYLKDDFNADFYKRAALIRDNIFTSKYGYKLGNYVEEPLDPTKNKRTNMFNIHHDWDVKKDDTMLNFFNYYGSVLKMKKEPGISWKANGTDAELKKDVMSNVFDNVHIKEILLKNKKVQYGIYNLATNPYGYKYRKSKDFLANVKPFNNSIGKNIINKIKNSGLFYSNLGGK